MRVDLQPAYILHSRPYRDTSLLIDFLTPDFGRVTAVARGVRKTKTPKRQLLNPFNRLLICWQGKSDMKLLTSFESDNHFLTLIANHLYSGFYLNELFRFEPELNEMMHQSIEMGRAFITKEYQQKPMPLFLLWKGIIHTTLRFPEHKYLIGGVSISNQFSDFSKSLMIEFMKSNYYDPYVAQYIHPKKAYKVKLKDADKDFIFNETEADLNKFDKIIDELEPGILRLPVLIKKYIKQNAKVVAFNVDPLFNNAIDGLMYIRIADIPESTMKPVMEEFQAELEKKFNEKGE